jgi:wyosine [tRNA(Phe)-imidazoG37] synthetase (radical SAM superfamily)
MQKFRYVFGPIPSRRLGMSLGVDLVPHKICNYDCVFCEIGRTIRTVNVRKEYIKKDDIISELESFFENFSGQQVDHITLTGSGETTLNVKLGEIIKEIKEKFSYPVAVLTHSGNIYDSQVREELRYADVVCPSLDAATQEVFEKVNKPHPGIKISEVIEGLRKFREIFKGTMLLEVLLVDGINNTEEELRKIGEAARYIGPDSVQINTVDRPGAYPEAKPLTHEQLEFAKSIIEKYHPNVVVLSRTYKHLEKVRFASEEEFVEELMNMIKRRPMTTLDIVASTGLDFFEVSNVVKKLLEGGKLEEIKLNGNRFYRIPMKSQVL